MATKVKLPFHLAKGGNVPMSIAPIYYYVPELNSLQAFQTLQKQPRTLKYSVDFDFKQQLLSEYPQLKLSALDEYKSSQKLLDLRFDNVVSEGYADGPFQKMNSILTPNNLYNATKSFSPSYWEFGGHAFELNEIPSAGDMTLSDSFGEVCLAGQSNAGKSSLVNVLMGSADFHQGFAVVSKVAGRTRVK